MVKHLTFAAIVDGERDEARAWADAIALTVGEPGEPCPVVAAGRYHDELRREQGHWRFARRAFVYCGQPVPEGLSASSSASASASVSARGAA
jgi:hypothetical protein